MTLQDKLTIERALGIIEGVSCGVGNPFASILNAAVEMIEGVMEKEETEE